MRYEKYKNVSLVTLPFVSSIPVHWCVVPLKYAMQNLDYLREPIAADQRPRTNPQYDYYGASGVIDRIDYYNVDDTVLLIGEDGANLVYRNLPLIYRASGQFWVNNHAHILKPKNDDYGYMAYLMEAMDYFHLITGAAQPKLSQESLSKVRLLSPPLPEQKSISSFLDDKCGKIDRWVAAKEREVALLKELKQAMIAEAVTGATKVARTDTARKMKPSGIPWLPEVPEGWEVRRVKSIAKISNGSDPKTEGDIPVYGSGGKSFKTCGEYKEGPVVLLGRKGSIEIPHYIVGRYWNVDTAFDVRVNACANLRWFYYLAMCFDYHSYLSRTVLPSMTQTSYYGMRIPFPSLSEQAQIAHFLDEKCGKIDAAVVGLEREVAAMKEYKQRLIADVVTGQRTVS